MEASAYFLQTVKVLLPQRSSCSFRLCNSSLQALFSRFTSYQTAKWDWADSTQYGEVLINFVSILLIFGSFRSSSFHFFILLVCVSYPQKPGGKHRVLSSYRGFDMTFARQARQESRLNISWEIHRSSTFLHQTFSSRNHWFGNGAATKYKTQM